MALIKKQLLKYVFTDQHVTKNVCVSIWKLSLLIRISIFELGLTLKRWLFDES